MAKKKKQRKKKVTKQEVQKKLEELPSEVNELLIERRHLTLKKSKSQSKIISEIEKEDLEKTKERIAEIDKKIDDYEKSREAKNG